jgi:hypothetical protein
MHRLVSGVRQLSVPAVRVVQTRTATSRNSTPIKGIPYRLLLCEIRHRFRSIPEICTDFGLDWFLTKYLILTFHSGLLQSAISQIPVLDCIVNGHPESSVHAAILLVSCCLVEISNSDQMFRLSTQSFS